ncbi:hypothetical protein FBU59_006463 [Linderina macrospora]|uniref:Uncharacterized protein n=1 Tax=Linderina macrospora TaxID=4868 RepID=A0ACC1IZP2_9FUNG|nr:hypothetical protein FBU59_006463 [Linderina macrospora]
MSNPQFAQNMMSMHPQLRRAMDENPELRNMINDPEMLRQTMHAASNPMLMQELQRSNDRALANLEAMPGGLAQIRRIYNNFQEPMTPGPMGGPPESLEMLNARRARVMGVKIPDRNAVNTSPLPNPQSMPQAYARQGMHTSLNDQVSRNAERLAQLNLSSPGGSAQQRQQQQHQQQQQQLQAARNVMAENPFGLSSYPPSDAFGLFQPAFRPGASGIQQQQQQQAPPQMSSMYMTNPDASASSSATAAPVQHQQQHLNTAPGHTISEAERASLRQRFQSELSQLEEMGFLDQDKNLRALSVTNGDLSLALNLIAEDD